LIKELNSDSTRKVRLVGVDEIFETEDEYKRTSILSPVGKPMIGKKIGDKFTVNAPIGKREFEILEIK
jgi:transcription elongation factor GreA